MNSLYQACKVLSILLFLYYGLAVFVSDAMVTEFERFGYFLPHLTVVAAGGLALLMAVGVVVRLRCRDSLVDALPATVMLLLNLFIVVYTLAMVCSRRATR